jgi:thiol:disulfide interchange protein DsbA
MQRYVRILPFLAALFFTPLAQATTTDLQPITEGQDYTRLQASQPLPSKSKIVVTEFFWYRCPHCNHLRPALEAWEKKLPKDVEVRYVPAVFRDNWVPAARICFALQDVGAFNRLNDKVFDAYHVKMMNLDDESVLFPWIQQQGVDLEKFKAAYNSFYTQTRIREVARVEQEIGIDGVPSFMVDGKFTTSQSKTITEERLFETLDYLIQKERAERFPKKAGKTKNTIGRKKH